MTEEIALHKEKKMLSVEKNITRARIKRNCVLKLKFKIQLELDIY